MADYSLIIDDRTGDAYIPITQMRAFVGERFDKHLTEVELVRRFVEIGCRREYMEATNPEPPHDVIGIDFIVMPAALWRQMKQRRVNAGE